MKKYYPKFYEKATCLAEKCPDTCCAEWEIPLSEDDLSRLGEKLPQTLLSERYITLDKDGDRCFRLNNGRCPFLTPSGLCKIRLEYSYEITPDVCRQHPLFIEEYDGFIECCPSLSCPSVCTEVFSEKSKGDFYPTVEYDGENTYLKRLVESRQRIIDLLQCEDVSFERLFSEVNLRAGEADGQEYSSVTDEPEYFTELLDGFIDELRDECEILSDRWKALLTATSQKAFDFGELKSLSSDEKRFASYMVYRYWLKSINDENAKLYSDFIVLSLVACKLISRVTAESFQEITRLFSKEIEHDTDNVDILLDFVYSFI